MSKNNKKSRPDPAGAVFPEITAKDLRIAKPPKPAKSEGEAIKKAVRTFTECPFCHEKQYVQMGRDATTNWCNVCGRAYEAHWMEEEV